MLHESYILNILKQITDTEKVFIENKDFETLWKELWKPLSKNKMYLNIIHYTGGMNTYKSTLTNCDAEKNQFKDIIACYRAFAPIIRTGDLYRLWDPFKVSTSTIYELC